MNCTWEYVWIRGMGRGKGFLIAEGRVAVGGLLLGFFWMVTIFARSLGLSFLRFASSGLVSV
jgi:hypothetical protein